MKQRIYIDTSVIGGYFDAEFKEYTKPLFEQIQNSEIRIIYSEVTERELVSAPEKLKELIRDLPKEVVDFVELTEEVINLAHAYINERVVGKSSFDDCLHIALATINKADYLVSWNFKHIVNVERIRGYNSVNIKLGYSVIDIRSPREFIKYED
jgi:predicted nucleic acid-binding protein